ncbi:GAF domain-containing sensor histidine kinase [Streptomyces sp. NBC_00344]|uniref:GAF domain-containing sensor histidine kinase n=1 Tax=Streptomyces sp. NBC_00344 TaxID=2975720 RepID=UPI002E209B4B
MSDDSRLPMLLEAVAGVGTGLGLRATLQHIVDSAADLTGARHGVLAVVDPERDRLSDVFSTGSAGEALISLPVDSPGLLRVPIQVDGETFGAVRLSGKRDGAFDADDEALLKVLAAQAGLAIGNARLYETAMLRERWIKGAATVTNALLTGETANDALTTVAEQARSLADAVAGVVLLPTETGGMEIVAASTFDDPGDLVGTTIEPGSSVLVQLLGGEPVFIGDSSTDPRMTTHVRARFGPSMMIPLQSGGKLIGTLALPRRRSSRPYSDVDRTLAMQFASQAALALVLADAQQNREQLAVYEDRDRIARDLHDLVIQRLFATEMMLESTRRRANGADLGELIGRAVDELDSTIQDVRTAIFALQQPPARAPSTLRGRVLRETEGAGVLLGFIPSVRFLGPVDSRIPDTMSGELLAELRRALALAHRAANVSHITVVIDARAQTVRMTVTHDGTSETPDAEGGTNPAVWEAPPESPRPGTPLP